MPIVELVYVNLVLAELTEWCHKPLIKNMLPELHVSRLISKEANKQARKQVSKRTIEQASEQTSK